MRDLQELFERTKDYLDAIDVPYRKVTSCTGVDIVGGSKRTYGDCTIHHDRKTGEVYFTIRIANFLLSDELTDEKIVISTIAHELVHTVEGCWEHNSNFKKWMALVGDCYGLDDGVRVNKQRRTAVIEAGLDNSPWILKCEKCGNYFTYYRIPKWLARYGYFEDTMTARNVSCNCKGQLKLVKYTSSLVKAPKYHKITEPNLIYAS